MGLRRKNVQIACWVALFVPLLTLSCFLSHFIFTCKILVIVFRMTEKLIPSILAPGWWQVAHVLGNRSQSLNLQVGGGRKRSCGCFKGMKIQKTKPLCRRSPSSANWSLVCGSLRHRKNDGIDLSNINPKIFYQSITAWLPESVGSLIRGFGGWGNWSSGGQVLISPSSHASWVFFSLDVRVPTPIVSLHISHFSSIFILYLLHNNGFSFNLLLFCFWITCIW